MNPHLHPLRHSAWAYLHQASPWASLGREVHFICMQLFPHSQGLPTPPRLYSSPILIHRVSRHRSCRHLLPALPSLAPSLLLLLICGALPSYLSPVFRLQLILRRLKGEADHADCLTNVCPQAHSIKQSDQAIKYTLNPTGVQQCNHAIVCVEEGILVPTLLSTLASLLSSLYHHRHPLLHHCIHYHIK